jgi:hypothetical protein
LRPSLYFSAELLGHLPLCSCALVVVDSPSRVCCLGGSSHGGIRPGFPAGACVLCSLHLHRVEGSIKKVPYNRFSHGHASTNSSLAYSHSIFRNLAGNYAPASPCCLPLLDNLKKIVYRFWTTKNSFPFLENCQ